MINKEIIRILNEVYYQPYNEDKNGYVQMSAIDMRETDVANQISNIDGITATELYAAIKLDAYGDKREEHDLYQIRKLLGKALAITDIDGQQLGLLALDDSLQWYSRVSAITALKQKGAVDQIAKLDVLLSRRDLEGEIRSSALEALSTCGFTGILPNLKKQYDDLESVDSLEDHHWYDAREKILLARGYLGDHTALRDLIAMTHDDWSHLRVESAESLDSLIEKMGGVALAVDCLITTGDTKKLENSDLGNALNHIAHNDQQDSVRSWANKALFTLDPVKASHGCVESLGDVDWLVASGASDILENIDSSGPLLLSIANDVDAGRSQKLWAIKTLLSMGQKIPNETLEAVKDLAVPWDFNVPPGLRAAIISTYALHSEPGTDVRYYIEAYLNNVDPNDDSEDEAVSVQRMLDIFENESISVTKIVSCGEFYQQGGGTFWLLDLGFIQIIVSTIGQYFSCISYRDELNFDLIDPPTDQDPRIKQVLNLLADNDFHIVSPEISENTVPGLNVYFFGSREPLDLANLLYYWQD